MTKRLNSRNKFSWGGKWVIVKWGHWYFPAYGSGQGSFSCYAEKSLDKVRDGYGRELPRGTPVISEDVFIVKYPGSLKQVRHNLGPHTEPFAYFANASLGDEDEAK